ncbi:MAG: DoxX family protein [Armatimonadetes bacterium]|nr:DoxX family protein [Akkermansiaceae bacterium]
MKKFFFDCGTRDATASLALVFLRITIGLMILIGHGLSKIQNFATLKDKFPVPDFFPLKYMSPPVSLIATIGAEVLAPALIVIGLCTRPAAFILAFAMTVAAFDVLHSQPFFYAPPKVLVAKELAIMYLLPAVAILLAGAGQYSVDSSFYKDGKRRKW